MTGQPPGVIGIGQTKYSKARTDVSIPGLVREAAVEGQLLRQVVVEVVVELRGAGDPAAVALLGEPGEVVVGEALEVVGVLRQQARVQLDGGTGEASQIEHGQGASNGRTPVANLD